jgi:ligand-binding sensor domain-containing protein
MVFLALGWLLCSVPAWSQPLPSAIANLHSQFHAHWSEQEGLPDDVSHMVQGADGYLWITSGNGLYRFDGVRFAKFSPERGTQLLSQSMECILALPDGGLWVSYQFGGASLIWDGAVVVSNDLNSTGHGSIQGFALDFDGNVWASNGFSLIRREGNAWKPIGADWNYTAKRSEPPTVDGAGNLWVSDGNVLYVLPRGSRRFESTGIRGVSIARHFDKSARNWVRGREDFPEIVRSDTGQWQERKTGLDHTSAAIVTDKGDLVFGVDAGLAQASHASLSTGSRLSEDGLHPVPLAIDKKPVFILSLLEDREGSIWVLSSNGLDQFRPTTIKSVDLENQAGLTAMTAAGNSLLVGAFDRSDTMKRIAGTVVTNMAGSPTTVSCLYTAPDGTVWVGGTGKLWRLRDGRFTAVPLPAGETTPTSDVQSLTVDHSGTLWAAILAPAGPLVFRLKDGAWSTYIESQTGRQPFPLSLLTDHDGNVWLGYSRNRMTIVSPDGKRKTIRDKDGLDVGTIITLYEHGDKVWIGGTAGLAYSAKGRLHSLFQESGTPFANVAGIIQRANGDLWLNMTEGVMRIAAADLERAEVSESHTVRGRLYTHLDGTQGAPGLVRPVPAAAETPDGRIYFSSKGLLAWVDPDSLEENKIAPTTSIDSMLMDGKRLATDTPVVLSKGTQNVQIDYTANSLLIPQRVRFRYRLDGFDKDWLDAGTRRQAFYSHLPPGRYSFSVLACNNDGVWGKETSSLDITLPPTFLQSWPFKILCVLLALGGLWLFYLARLNSAVASARAKLYERLAERERIARDLHDTFFQGIQGLLLRFNTGTAQLPPEEPARRIFIAALEQSDQVMLEGRELVLDLRATTETADLGQMLASTGEEFASLHKATFALSVSGQSRALHPVAAGDLYRLGREALYNAFHHADAEHVELELHYLEASLVLRVRDDGKGMEENILRDRKRPGHLGLPGMYERAEKLGAKLDLWSRPGSGTEVEVSVPAKTAYLQDVRSVFPGWLSRWGRRLRPLSGD